MKRIIFILLVTAVGVAASFIDAYYGLLLYTWYAFSSPLELTFGQLEGARLSLLVGAVVMLTTFHQKGRIMVKHRISLVSILFVFACFCSLAVKAKFGLTFVASELELITKIVLICLLTPLLLTSLERLRLYILVIVVSAGLLAAYYGVFGLFAGSRNIYGPGRIGDNNGYAVFITTLLPFIFFAGRHVPLQISPFLKGAATAGLMAANCLALVLTYSRGGFLAGSVVLLLLLTQLRSRAARIFGWGVVIPFLTFSIWNIFIQDPNLWRIPEGEQSDSVVERTIDGYLERLSTLRYDLEGEQSAGGRLHFWKVALRMVEEHPVTGVGLNRYPHAYSRFDFSDGRYGDVRAVHNTLLSVMSETGLFGFFAFIAIVVLALFSQQAGRRKLPLLQDQDNALEMRDYIVMQRIALVGFFAGGTFVTALYQEIFWAVISISIAMERIAEDMLHGPSRQKRARPSSGPG